VICGGDCVTSAHVACSVSGVCYWLPCEKKSDGTFSHHAILFLDDLFAVLFVMEPTKGRCYYG